MKRIIVFLIALALPAATISCATGDDLGPTPPVQYDLTISATDGGSVLSPGVGVFTCDAGATITLVAVADECYGFVEWTGDAVSSPQSAVTTVIVNAPKVVSASFALARYSLTLNGATGGSVTAPNIETSTYDCGAVVDLVAEPEEGYQFTCWTGSVGAVDDLNAASTSVTMMGDYTITANFAKEIRTWYDLDAIRDNLGGSYVLMNDLDSTTAGYAELAGPAVDGGKGWQPIGFVVADPLYHEVSEPAAPFSGRFDGRGHEVRDLSVGRDDEDGVGLFGFIGTGGVVENLGVVNADVTGSIFVGGVVGLNDGTVTNSYSSGKVSGRRGIGGVVGWNHGTVRDSLSGSKVAGEWAIGGLVGCNWGSVHHSHASSGVTGISAVGGLVGLNFVGTVSDSHSSGSVLGGWSVGGLVGETTWGASVRNSHYNYDEVLINGRNLITVGAMFAEDFEQWLANDRALEITERLAKEEGYYAINNVSDFKQVLAFGQDKALRFRLKADLDLSDEPDFYIAYLAGEFDGNGHLVSGVTFGADFVCNVGLFGYVASGGKVTRVGVENANIVGIGGVGGLVGWNDGTVTNCYSRDGVIQGGSAGGLVGAIHRGAVVDSYASGTVAGGWGVGGLVGWNYYGTVRNSHYNYDEVLINGKNLITIGAMFDEHFGEWLANDKFLDINKRLAKEEGYYVINSVSDFKEVLAFGQVGSLRFRLNDDLNLVSEPDFYIPYLAGEFDGNGHQILNLSLSLDAVSNVGLFGYVASGGTVTRVRVENTSIIGTGTVGGLVGYNAWGSTVSTSYSSGTVAGSWGVGGLVAWNDGDLNRSYSVVTVSGDSRVGGLAGTNGGRVSNSYCNGSVTGRNEVGGLVGVNGWGGFVSNSFSSSRVIGDQGVGGLVGYSLRGAVANSFWDVEASGTEESEGGNGRTTAEMRDLTTFARWDIGAVASGETNSTYIWNIVDGQGYPFLSWQSVS